MSYPGGSLAGWAAGAYRRDMRRRTECRHCHVTITPASQVEVGVGRPRLYCSPQCRRAEYERTHRHERTTQRREVRAAASGKLF